jgi:hypothetical protein
MAPSRDYVPPSSSFFFAPGVETTSLMTYLPSKSMVNRLIEHYWEAVHVIAKTVHRPSFERHLQRFWDNLHAGIEPRFSFQAVLFAALLTSIVSMSDDKVIDEFGVDKRSLVDNFQQGTESALAKANFLRTTKLETMQAFVMYLVGHPLHADHYPPLIIYLVVWSSCDRFVYVVNTLTFCPDSTVSRRSLACAFRFDRDSHPSGRVYGSTSRSDMLQ